MGVFTGAGRRTWLNWPGYLSAIALVALATWLKYIAQPNIIPAGVPILYILAIVLTATFFGLLPAILASILSVIAWDYFFVPPIHTLGQIRIEDYPIIAIFFAVGLLISYLSYKLRQKSEEASQELAARKKADLELEKHRDHLEELVAQRTAELEKLNLALIAENAERKKAEETLRVYTGELESANKELEAFSYSVSHDLRAPLRGIDGFSYALLEDCADKLDAHGRNYLDQIRHSTQLMGRLIDDMLKLSRTSRAEIHPDNVNLSEIVKSIALEIQGSQPLRTAEFIISPGLYANGDTTLLTALLRNLIENAWKFTGRCQATRIEFGEENQRGKLAYFIRDNGIGFDMQYSHRLFKPFSRLHDQNEYPGNGIGLANVHRIIRRHGGDIWAEARPGEGATFYFTLGPSPSRS